MDGAVGERAQAIVQRTERNCPLEVTLLPLVVNGWHLGAVLSPELRPAVRRPVVRTAVSTSGPPAKSPRPRPWAGGTAGFPKGWSQNARSLKSHSGRTDSRNSRRLGSVVGGFGYEDDLDVAAVDAGFFLGAEGKGCDGLASGLGEQRGPMGGAVDVELLDGYGDLGEDVIGGTVGREDEVSLVELVGLVGVDVAPGLGVTYQGFESLTRIRASKSFMGKSATDPLPSPKR